MKNEIITKKIIKQIATTLLLFNSSPAAFSTHQKVILFLFVVVSASIKVLESNVFDDQFTTCLAQEAQMECWSFQWLLHLFSIVEVVIVVCVRQKRCNSIIDSIQKRMKKTYCFLRSQHCCLPIQCNIVESCQQDPIPVYPWVIES